MLSCRRLSSTAVRTGSTDNSGAIELTATRRIRVLIIQNLVSRRATSPLFISLIQPEILSSADLSNFLVSQLSKLKMKLEDTTLFHGLIYYLELGKGLQFGMLNAKAGQNF